MPSVAKDLDYGMERREEKGGGTGCCERGIEQARTSSSMDDMNAGPHD
jgi:hypothetical protein